MSSASQLFPSCANRRHYVLKVAPHSTLRSSTNTCLWMDGAVAAPRLVERLCSFNDKPSAAIVELIGDQEKAHVAVGVPFLSQATPFAIGGLAKCCTRPHWQITSVNRSFMMISWVHLQSFDARWSRPIHLHGILIVRSFGSKCFEKTYYPKGVFPVATRANLISSPHIGPPTLSF